MTHVCGITGKCYLDKKKLTLEQRQRMYFRIVTLDLICVFFFSKCRFKAYNTYIQKRTV